MADIATWVLRGFGVLWVLGAAWLTWQLQIESRVDDAIDKIERMNVDLDPAAAPAPQPADRVRTQWLKAGAILTLMAGIAMATASRWAVPLLALLIVQQMGYFFRQRRREVRAPTVEAAQDARPTRETVNGFYTSLLMAVLASWLYFAGKLT